MDQLNNTSFNLSLGNIRIDNIDDIDSIASPANANNHDDSDSSDIDFQQSANRIQHEESKTDSSALSHGLNLNPDVFNDLHLNFRSDGNDLQVQNRDTIEERMRILRNNFEHNNYDSSSNSSDSSIQPLSTCSKIAEDDPKTDFNMIGAEEVKNLLQCTI